MRRLLLRLLGDVPSIHDWFHSRARHACDVAAHKAAHRAFSHYLHQRDVAHMQQLLNSANACPGIQAARDVVAANHIDSQTVIGLLCLLNARIDAERLGH